MSAPHSPSCEWCGYSRVFATGDASSARRWKAGDLVCIFTAKGEAIGETHTGGCRAYRSEHSEVT